MAAPESTSPAQPARFSIAGLAHAAAMTPRNIRLYQTRGLLEPPQREARAAVYTQEHLDRLVLIQRLQADGMSLDLIQRVLEGEHRGTTSVLELAARLQPSDAGLAQDTMTPEQLLAQFGTRPEGLRAALERGVLVPRDDGDYDVRDAALLRIGKRGVKLGLPIERILEVWDLVDTQTTQGATHLVEMMRHEVWERFERGERTEADWERVVRTFEDARRLAADVYTTLLERAIDAATTQVIQQIADEFAAVPPSGDTAGSADER